MSEKQTRIVWNAEETYWFLYHYASIMLDEPGTGIREGADEAQKQAIRAGRISASRSREVHNASFLTAAMREKLVEMREKVLRDRINCQEKAEQEQSVAVDHVHEALVENVLSLLGDARIQDKLREIFNIPKIITYPMGQPAAARVTAQPVSEDVKRKKRVFIVGLKGTQPEAMRKFAGHRLDLHFLDANDKRDRMRQQAAAADVSIVMVGYVNHDVTAVVKKAAQAHEREYKQVLGTVTDLQRVVGLIQS